MRCSKRAWLVSPDAEVANRGGDPARKSALYVLLTSLGRQSDGSESTSSLLPRVHRVNARERDFRQMPLAARGLLYTLRLECWENHRLPADWASLPAFLGLMKAKSLRQCSGLIRSSGQKMVGSHHLSLTTTDSTWLTDARRSPMVAKKVRLKQMRVSRR